jgi:endonuclease YncB( thermonuclease family)
LLGDGPPDCYRIERDKYGRQVGLCFSAAGLSLNAEMVKAGWAVAYARYSLAYSIFEAWARIRRRGLWAGDFETPEAYRHAQ